MRDLTVAAALGWTCHVKKIPEDLSFKAFSPWRQVHYKESTVQIGATGTPFAGVPLKPERNLGAEDQARRASVESAFKLATTFD